LVAVSQTARFGVCIHAGLEPADRDDLVGAVAGALQGLDNATTAHPDMGGMQEVRQLVSQIAFASQRKGRSIYDFGEFVKSFDQQKILHFIGQHKGGSKNCFSQVKACVFPRLQMEARGNPKDLLRPCCPGDANTKCILEAMMQSIDSAICLQMISSGLTVRNAKHVAQCSPYI
jgi:hypothetical protein